METITVKDVSRTYYDTNGDLFKALDNVSLEWKSGESIAVMGESGSGKSTLARLIIGLEKPSSGKILFDGEDTSKWRGNRWRRCRTEIQAAFQDEKGTLSPSRSVMQNAEEALCNLTSMKKSERYETILRLMVQMGLSNNLLSVPVRALSGGEQRRLGLLRALAVRPKFLVLDEVTAGLDLITTESILDLLADYKKDHGCSYMLITHDLSAASRLCSRMFEIEHGQIIHESVQ